MHAAQHLPAFIQALEPFISRYGYFGVGGLLVLEDFGIPVPGETVLVAASVFAGLGRLNIVVVFIVGFLGAVIGDNIGFAIGAYGGHPLVERYGKYVFVTPQRLAKVEAFFARFGGRIVVIARFIEGLRQLNGIIAGLSEMRWPRFVTYNVLGAALWVGVWSAVGFYGGSHIVTFLDYQLHFSVATIAVLLGWFGYRKLKHRRSNHGQT